MSVVNGGASRGTAKVGNRPRPRDSVRGSSPRRARREMTSPTLTPSSSAIHLAASSTSSSMARMVRTSRAYRRRLGKSKRSPGRMSVSVLSMQTKASRRARSRTWRSGRRSGAEPSGSVVSAGPRAGRTLSFRQGPRRALRLTHPAAVHRLTPVRRQWHSL